MFFVLQLFNLNHYSLSHCLLNPKLDGLLASWTLWLGEAHLPCGMLIATHGVAISIPQGKWGYCLIAMRWFDCQPNGLKRIASVPPIQIRVNGCSEENTSSILRFFLHLCRDQMWRVTITLHRIINWQFVVSYACRGRIISFHWRQELLFYHDVTIESSYDI